MIGKKIKAISNLMLYLGWLITTALLYFQLTYWQIGAVGWGLFIVFLIIGGSLWADIFFRLLGQNPKQLSIKIVGVLTCFFLVGLVAAVFVALNRLTSISILLCLLIAAAATSLLHFTCWRLRKVKYSKKNLCSTPRFTLFSGRSIYLLAYFIFYLLCFYLLFYKSNGTFVNSPWQHINNYYVVVFFVLTILLSVLLLSKIKTKVLLFVLVLHSLLLHAYVPLSNPNPVGGDVWRHVANEKVLASEQYIYPVLFGDKLDVKDFGSISLPLVFLKPQKFSYAHFWGTNVLINRITGTDFYVLHKYIVPLIWSIGFTLLVFLIGTLIFRSMQRGLWLTGLSMLPFSLQAFGAISMPVSFNLILFLLLVWWWLRYLQKRQKKILLPVLLFTPLLFFSYFLYLMLFLVVIVLSLIGIQIKKIDSSFLKKGMIGLVSLLSLIVLPVVELLSGYSRLATGSQIIIGLKQLAGQLSGWYFSSLIRSHDMLSGNLFINHIPQEAFVQNIFTDFRWHILVGMVLVWLMIFVGILKTVRSGKTIPLVFFWSLCALLGGYIIGWTVLTGDRLLTRRLDGVLVFVLIVFLLHGLNGLVTRRKRFIKLHIPSPVIKGLGVLLIVFVSWFGTTTYATGPDIRTLTKDEYDAGVFLSEQIKGHGGTCVLADTWVLLALEAETSGQIIGGGFPIDYQFAQPDRVRFFKEALIHPSDQVWNEVFVLTKAKNCYFVSGSDEFEHENEYFNLMDYYGEPLRIIGDFKIWQKGFDYRE